MRFFGSSRTGSLRAKLGDSGVVGSSRVLGVLAVEQAAPDAPSLGTWYAPAVSERSDELYQRAQELPPEERALLALQLLDSVGEPEAEIERAWGEEVRRRIEDVEAGRAVLVPWDEAKQRIFARTRR